MELLQAIRSRRAVRDYTDETLDTAVIHRLIDAAIQAPSAMNEQPWSFTVVRDRRLLERISAASRALILTRPPQGLRSKHLSEMLRNPGLDIFYKAAALIVISSSHGGEWAIADCALAAQNLMLAAAAEGLGSCWIGLAQGWLQTPEGKEALGLSSECFPVAPIIIGHPRAAVAPVARKEPRISWIGP
jgi:nitroreductase